MINLTTYQQLKIKIYSNKKILYYANIAKMKKCLNKSQINHRIFIDPLILYQHSHLHLLPSKGLIQSIRHLKTLKHMFEFLFVGGRNKTVFHHFYRGSKNARSSNTVHTRNYRHENRVNANH